MILPDLLDYTIRMARQQAQREFDLLDIGVSVEQWVILKLIQKNGRIPQAELAYQTFRDPAAITRTLAGLQKIGLVVKYSDPSKARGLLVELTKEGQYFVFQNMPLVNNLRNKTTKGFSRHEIDQLSYLLARMRSNMNLQD